MPNFNALSPLFSDPNCVTSTKRTRAIGSERVRIGSDDYIAVNTGNGITFVRVTDPGHPVIALVAPKLTTGYAGDIDLNLQQFSIGRRFGAAAFPGQGSWSEDMGLTVFELDTNHGLTIVDRRQYANGRGDGCVVFHRGERDFLLARWDDSPFATASLLAIDDVHHLRKVCDVGLSGGRPLHPTWGKVIAGDLLYVFDESGDGHVFRISGSGDDLDMTHQSSPFRAGFTFSHGAAFDETAGIGATASGEQITLWDIQRPDVPRQIAQIAGSGRVTSVALGPWMLWRAAKGARGGAAIFDITDPAHPVECDPGFWDTSRPWNALTACQYEYDGAFSADGSLFIRAAYSVCQPIAISDQEPTTGGDPMPDVPPTNPPADNTAPGHGHIEPTFNPIQGAGKVLLFARPATVDIGQKVLLTVSGVRPEDVQSADFYLGGTGCFGWVGQHTEPGLNGGGLAAEVRYASEGTYTAAVTVHTKNGPLQGTCVINVTAEGSCPAEPDTLYPPRSPILSEAMETPATTSQVVEPGPDQPPVEPTTGPVTDARPAEIKAFIEVTLKWDDALQAYLTTLG